MPNRLSNSTSPYLLQHAGNPVAWQPWDQQALQQALDENKPILLSVGYSACHWCHVMEKNCFENEAIASLMNTHFVCIKVDREERPDVDQVYMDALHLMGQRGGWPLNVFLTPTQLPFFGGTYFAPMQWTQVLTELAAAWQKDPGELKKIGEDVKRGLTVSDLDKYLHGLKAGEADQGLKKLETVIAQLQTSFDGEYGGFGTAPKFPMPAVLDFLLFHHHLFEGKEIVHMATHTLDKMAFGGIHDQLGGGFARYSVDNEWKVPHFEKMLYDNAQLLSLYSHAYAATLDILYRDVAIGLIGFVKTEMTSPEGAFYSALDADSEGVEGKFYTWTKAGIMDVLGADGEEFCNFYQVTDEGNFEHGTNVLWRTLSQEDFTQLYSNRSHADMHQYITVCRRKLLDARSNRVRPGLDDKVITSWNALMAKGLVDAYRIFDHPEMLKLAYDNLSFIKEKMIDESGHLWHTYKDGVAHIDGFLDDYAFTIDALVALYESTFHEDLLHQAKTLADYAIAHFYDPAERLFFYTSSTGESLIARKKEVMDNVIPASNSAMAMSLHCLGALFCNEKYGQIVDGMLAATEPLILSDGRYMANWLQVWFMRRFPSVELTFVGKNALRFKKEVDKIFFPNKVVCGTTGTSTLPLLENRMDNAEENTQIFVCQNKVCRTPVDNVPAALRILKMVKEEMVQTQLS